MRRIYQEATVERDGFYTYSSARLPDFVDRESLAGTAATFHLRPNRIVDGDQFYYSKESISKSFTYFTFPKHGWLKASGTTFHDIESHQCTAVQFDEM